MDETLADTEIDYKAMDFLRALLLSGYKSMTTVIEYKGRDYKITVTPVEKK